MGFITKVIDAFKSSDRRAQVTVDINDIEFKSDIEREMYRKNTMGYRDTRNRLAYQEKLLQSVNDANAKYAEDGDLDSLIKAYEFAFIESNPPCASSQNLSLSEYYVRKGEYDKAWGYLNFLQETDAAETVKIRHEQAKILKKEKRYIPALDMILAEHLLKYSNRDHYHKNMFIKDAGVCVRALKWDKDILEDLSDILEKQLLLKDYDEVKIHNSFEEYLKSHNLL